MVFQDWFAILRSRSTHKPTRQRRRPTGSPITQALESRVLLAAAVNLEAPARITDGFIDIVGRNANTGTVVVAVSDGTQLRTQAAAVVPPGVDWDNLITGDFNGDGLTDLAGLSPSDGQWRVLLASQDGFTDPQLWGAWSANVTFGDLLVGDFNDDGLDDVAGRASTGTWVVGLSDGLQFVSSGFGAWSANVGWADVQVADLNGDGRTDIIGRASTGTWVAGLSDGTRFQMTAFGAWSANVSWQDVQVGDFNGDGFNDVIGRASNGRWVAGISDSTRFDMRSFGIWSTNVAWTFVTVGDVNGDGRDDVVARASTGTWVAGLSNGAELETVRWGAWSNKTTWDIVPGDFNNDGLLDMAGRDPYGRWWLARSDGSRFINEVWNGWSASVDWDNILTGNFIPRQDDVAVRRERLSDMVIALYLYHDSFRQFPTDGVPGLLDAGGKPFLSWRVHVLPFIGYGDLYQQFRLNEPWDSPNNIALLDQMPDEFRTSGLAVGTNRSGYRVFEGPGAFEYDAQGGPLIRDAADGAQQTLMLIETMPQDAVSWTRPDGIPFNPSDPLGGLTLPPDSFLTATVDGTVREVNPFVAPANFAATLTWDGGEVLTTGQFADIYLDWSPDDSRETSRDKLKAISIAFNNFHDVNRYFPPGGNVPAEWFDPVTGKPYLSWRVHLLPYLGYGALYAQFNFDEPWNSPNNIGLLDKMPEAFRSRGLTPGGTTSAFKVIDGPEAYQLNYIPGGTESDGPRIIGLLDGTATTIAVVELTPDKAVPWTQWNEVEYSPANPLEGLGPIPAGGLNTVLWNGSTRTISPAATPEKFGIFATSNQGEIFGPADSSNVFFDWAEVDSTDSRRVKLRSVGFALYNYYDVFGHFPASGGDGTWYQANGLPNLSWCVYLLPYLGLSALYREFNLGEPWDSPNNIQLLDKMPEFFRSRGLPSDSTKTGLQVFLGEGAWTYQYNANSSASGPRRSDITDGTSNTIAVIETMPEDAVEWTRPDGDIPWNPADPYGGLTIPPDFFLVMMFDTSVRAFHPFLDEEEFRAFVTIAGGEPITYEN